MDNQPNNISQPEQLYHPKHHIKVYVWIALVVAALLVAANAYVYFQRLSYLRQGAQTAYESEQKIQELRTQRDTLAGSVQVPDDWKTYTNEEYGFEFRYPGDWDSKNTEIEGPNILLSVFLGKFENPDFIDVRVFSNSDRLSISDFYKSVIMGNEFTGLYIETGQTEYDPEWDKMENISLNGSEALKISTEWFTEIMVRSFIMKNDKVIGFYTSYFSGVDEPEKQRLEQLFDQILSTFRFTR